MAGVETTTTSSTVSHNAMKSDGKNENKPKLKGKHGTHFLAIRVVDPDSQSTAGHIQNLILEKEPHLQECCIPPTSIHVTACTLGLDTPEQIAHATQVINRIKPELEAIVPKDKPLKMKGLQNFFNRVLYAEVQCPPEFYNFVDHLKLRLNQEGVEIRDNHEFVAHMTLMKVTRANAKATGIKCISPRLYSHKAEVEFGSQAVDNMALCEMGKRRRDDGFYITPTEIKW